ncbi:hypothetical protein Fmac_029769 [Flemingia macrophylla]|uniref:Uncharacterized protein n=1 Tax=Flemingia macrophylla TaxID=520843 RepID=A0ABD1LBA8_9FABA
MSSENFQISLSLTYSHLFASNSRNRILTIVITANGTPPHLSTISLPIFIK